MALTSVLAAVLMCRVLGEPSSLRGSEGNITGVNRNSSLRAFHGWPHPGCCTGCSQFCSPNSGRCYDKKGKYYYLECSASTGGGEHQDCCSSCGAFCSPKSGNCYAGKGQSYYLDCRSYYFVGNKRCSFSRGNGMISYTPQVSSATDCRVACQNTPFCKVFNYAAPDTACGGGPTCQLFSEWCSSEATEDPCWEMYNLD